MLKAITKKNRTFDSANVHMYSHLAAARIKQRVSNGETLLNAWKATQLEMKQLFGLVQISTNINKGVEQLRLSNGSGRFRKDNANLLLFTGSFLAAGGDADALDLLTSDFADDGEINGVSLSFYNAVASMGASDGLIDDLANNLRNYGVRNPPNSGDLSQLPIWVNQNPVDTVAPVITVTGDNPVTVYVGTTYNDAGATAVDDIDGAVTAAAINNSDVIDTSVISTHTVTYSAVDAAGNTSTATRTVNVVITPDVEAPVITLLGGNTQTLDVYTGGAAPQYQDPGYTVTDNRDANVSVNVAGSVNMGVVGSYELTYSAADAAGNNTSVVRTVSIVDRTAPVVTLTGLASIEIYQGFAYTDQGATALDAYDGVLTVSLSGSVDVNTLGVYELVYTATDNANNSASVTRNVTVVATPDTIAPVITVTGDNPATVYVGVTYNDAGATAIDDVDGAVTAAAINNSDVIDTSVVATHTVTYSAADAAGNTSTATRTVNVVNAPDTIAPVITVTGDNPATVYVGVTYNDAGATAIDDVDGAVTTTAINNSDVIDTSVVATHTVTYSAADVAGNTSTATRTVNVVNAPDTVAPVITLLGDASLVIQKDATYTDAGATATDNVDGDITANISVNNPVNPSSPETYTVTYTVSDAAGNQATAVTRSVRVNAPPVANAGADIAVRKGDTITLNGSATDSDGTITSYRWTGASNFEYATTSSFDLVTSNMVLGDILLTLTVEDNDGSVASDSVLITILPALIVPAEMTFTYGTNLTIETGTYANSAAFYDYLKTQIVIRDQQGNIFQNDNGAYHFEFDGISGPVGSSPGTWEDFDPTTAGIGTVTVNYVNDFGEGINDIETNIVINQLQNPSPVANAGSDVTITLGESVQLDGSASSDSNGTIASYVWSAGGNQIGTTVSLNYTPDTVGTHVITLTVTDNEGATNTDTVNVTVSAVNQAPVVEDQYVQLDQDTRNNSIELIAVDPDGDTITFTYGQPDNGTISGNGSFLLYTPDAGYTGRDRFTFTASDGVASSSARVLIAVNSVATNTAPVAYGQTVSFTENSSSNLITLQGTDVDGDALTYAITVNPSHGTFTINGAHVSYTPELNYTGTDSFEFTVNDGTVTSAVATVDINMTPVIQNTPHIVFSQDPLYLPIGFDRAQLTDKIYSNAYALSASGNLSPPYVDYFFDTSYGISNDNLSAVGTYFATVALLDVNDESTVDEKLLTIEVVPTGSNLLNISPVIGQLSEQNIVLNQSATIGDNSSSVISDQDGSIVSYEWTENNVVISNALTFDYTATTLGEHLLTLTVTDDKGAIAIGTKTINVMLSNACHATAITEAAYVDNFIINKVGDTPWPSNLNNVSLTVGDIASAFNAARPNGEYQIGQTFVMPTQTVWDNFSDSEKALYLINAERCVRGIRPYEGISETVVTDTAQYYANHLASNNVFGHTEDGRTPWERLNQLSGVIVNGAVGNADFFSRAENLALNAQGSTGAFPTVHEPIAKAVYAWMYDDKEATRQGAAAPYTYTYGHREFILARGLNDNFGEQNKEGLIGVATASTQETANGFNWTKVYTVMNGFDPNENWIPNTPIKKVDYISPTECADPIYVSEIITNADGISYLACMPIQ